MHSSKGQEWRSVFVLKAVDGCISSDLGVGSHKEIEEERRLLYVGMTRAKDSLELTIPQRNAYPGVPGPQDLGHLPGRRLTGPPLYPGLGD